MTVNEMKALKPNDMLIDAICIKRKLCRCMVLEVCESGIKVTGIGEDRIHYVNPYNSEDATEVLPWSDAYGLDSYNKERENEPGYLR